MVLTIKNLVVRAVSADSFRDDVGYDNDGWERLDLRLPRNHRPVKIALTLTIGPREERGADLFYLALRTRETTEKKDTDWKTQYTLYVDDFDWPKIKAEIISRIMSCTTDSWDDSLKLLRRKFYWEYEKTPRTRKKPPVVDEAAFNPRKRLN